MRCSYPSFATVCNLDGTPVLYGFVSYVHMSTLMYDKDIGSTVRRTVLDCDRGSRHNCRITALEYLLLLVGEDIAYHQQCEQAYRPVEALLTMSFGQNRYRSISTNAIIMEHIAVFAQPSTLVRLTNA